MKYNTENELMERIERIIDKKVKYYKTDWTEYDRPKFIQALKEKKRECYLIARESGTYFYTLSEILDTEYDFPATVLEYYEDGGPDPDNDYYLIDLEKLTVKKIPAKMPQHIKTARELLKRNKLATA